MAFAAAPRLPGAQACVNKGSEMATGHMGSGLRHRRVGMRVWLGAAFAGVALITASSIYVFVDDSSNRTLQSQAADLAVGRTFRLADELSGASKPQARHILADARTAQFVVFALTPKRRPIARVNPPVAAGEIEGAREAIRTGLEGQRFRRQYPENRIVAAAPIFGEEGVEGVVVSSSMPPPVLSRVKALMDLACHPADVARALGPLARRRPGLRVPGAFDGFEMALRAILGQQVTVAAARTIAGRFAAAFEPPPLVEVEPSAGAADLNSPRRPPAAASPPAFGGASSSTSLALASMALAAWACLARFPCGSPVGVPMVRYTISCWPICQMLLVRK